MEGIKRAIMDGIGQRFTLRGSGITADQNCSLSVSFRLMTNIWVGPKVFSAYHRLSVGHVCMRVCTRVFERDTSVYCQRSNLPVLEKIKHHELSAANHIVTVMFAALM